MLILAMSACVLGCSAESKLRTEGPRPYVRCIAGSAPDARTFRAGDWSFHVEDRVLRVEGPPRAFRLAAFSAPGLGGAPGAEALARLRETGADLHVLLGGLGDSEAAATATLAALASMSAPSLIVLGGRDTWAGHERAQERLENATILDGTVLRAVRIGSDTFVPVAGAENGRYAVSTAACGFGREDLDAAARELGGRAPGERRWLLSWHAPRQIGQIPGPHNEFGALLGSGLVESFAKRVGARGGLYAWPQDESERPRPGPLGLASVPRLHGPRLETTAGARPAHGVLVLDVDAGGVKVVL